MDTQKMVSRLTQHSIETALADPTHEWLQTLFRNGFKGFSNMTDAQLIQEMQFCGMLDFPEPEHAMEDECANSSEDDNELMVNLCGMLHVENATLE